ncbi:hypothetical protein [Maritalea sp.]|jgi:hypothetical protein|uniref:hypothetical protein n=1 Tax=Maritalea sp. TaxID=2003361 RepID=UPI0039E577A4
MSLTGGSAFGFEQNRHLTLDGCRFEWWVQASRLRCTFMAPATGWLAVGFGPSLDILGTRLLMVVPRSDGLKISDRLAGPSGPQTFAPDENDETFQTISGGGNGDQAWVSFAVPLPFYTQQAALVLANQKANLMLAWSTSKDFDHHSAWRRHFEINV